jgi:hypothetical protein
MRHEAVIRDHLRATLTPTLRTWFCYTCAKPAMRFSRNQTPEAPLPDLANDTADYHTIFQGTPTGLYPESAGAPIEPPLDHPTPHGPVVPSQMARSTHPRLL